jgi:hypothetical protein
LDINKPAFQDPLISEPIRVNLSAIASVNIGPTAPADPFEGLLWTDNSVPTNIKLKQFLLSAWRTILENIQAGPPSQSNVSKFVHNQAAPSTIWTVTHTLSTEDIASVLVKIGDFVVVPDTIEVIDSDTVEITFSSSVSGRAVLTG